MSRRRPGRAARAKPVKRATAERFAAYAGHMARELGDLVTTWITQNEPWVVAFLGHAQGRFAPGIRDRPTAVAVSHHLLLSHGLAVQALPGSVGITFNLSPVSAEGPGDEDAARVYDGHLNRWFLDPVLRGRRGRRAALLRVVAAGQLRVGGRLR